jgi:hypothetical protein
MCRCCNVFCRHTVQPGIDLGGTRALGPQRGYQCTELQCGPPIHMNAFTRSCPLPLQFCSGHWHAHRHDGFSSNASLAATQDTSHVLGLTVRKPDGLAASPALTAFVAPPAHPGPSSPVRPSVLSPPKHQVGEGSSGGRSPCVCVCVCVCVFVSVCARVSACVNIRGHWGAQEGRLLCVRVPVCLSVLYVDACVRVGFCACMCMCQCAWSWMYVTDCASCFRRLRDPLACNLSCPPPPYRPHRLVWSTWRGAAPLPVPSALLGPLDPTVDTYPTVHLRFAPALLRLSFCMGPGRDR